MNNNSIRSIDLLLIKLPSLKYLYMNYNFIIQIRNNTFKYNTKLEIIYLLNNKMKNFDLDLVKLKSQIMLFLSFNLLTMFGEQKFHIITGSNDITRIFIPKLCNDLHCNCAYNWRIDVEYENGIRIINLSSNCNLTNNKLRHIVMNSTFTSFKTYILNECPLLNLTHCKQG